MKFNRATSGTPYVGSFVLNPFEIAVGVLSLLLGFAFLLNGLHVPKSAILILPTQLILSWAALLLSGGVLMIVGVTWRGNWALGRGIEGAGLWLVFSAWSTYAITVAYVSVHTYLGIGFGVAMALGCLGRLIALRQLDKAMAHARTLPAGGDQD